MRNVVTLTVACAVLCLLCGCVLVPIALVGGGVVGGMAISEDTVQTEFDRTYDQVWDACISVLDKAGAIESKDKEVGIVQAYVPKSKVAVRVEQLTETTVRIQVKARKAARLLPDIKMAHKVAYRIGAALKEAPAPAASSTTK